MRFTGATAITANAATLNGNLVSNGGFATKVRLYYGATDGGTTPASWANVVDFGTLPAGPFAAYVPGLTNGTTYYYRTRGTNSLGDAWAASSASFAAASPQAPNVSPFTIGSRFSSSGVWPGDIAEVLIYDATLTVLETWRSSTPCHKVARKISRTRAATASRTS